MFQDNLKALRKKKGITQECRKADRLKMGKRSFRSRLRIADKAGGNFRGTGKPAAWLQNRSGRTAGRIGGTAFPNQRAACDQKQAGKKSPESVSLHRRRHYCRIYPDFNSCGCLYLFARPTRQNVRQLAVCRGNCGKRLKAGRFHHGGAEIPKPTLTITKTSRLTGMG